MGVRRLSCMIRIVMTVFIFSTWLVVSPWVAAKSNVQTLSLRSSAEKGDPKAQLEYGKSIKDQSREEAAKWIQKAADQGSGEAWYLLGYMGLGTKQAEYYYEKAAEKSYPEAFQPLLDALIFRAGSAANIEKAKKFADLARKNKISFGYSSEDSFQVIDRCFEAGPPKMPVSDLPTSVEKKQFLQSKAECGSYNEGVDQERDLVSFRKCLLSQEDQDNVSLAEIYANGWGVKRNAMLAIALVCRGSMVPAELEGMVNTLYSTKSEDRLRTEFTFCDHATSGLSGGFCAAEAEKIEAKKRSKEVTKISEKWSDSQKLAFFKLKTAAEDFFDESASSEQDLSGSGRAQFVINEQAAMKQDFMSSLEAFEKGQLPSDKDFAGADKELNRVYALVMKRKYEEGPGAVTKEGIRSTQRKWVTYRDAWVEFGKSKYPEITTEAWKAWLTKKRIAKLKEFVESN
jgi:uncharacterized protein YecT (DUF1311 family)